MILTPDTLRKRLALPPPADPDGHGDHTLNPAFRAAIIGRALKDAAVLIPIVWPHEGEARVILTKRSNGLRAHTGQVAFPGGRIDAGDAGPEDAALREAAEEIALDRTRAETLGRLPDYLTGSGYRIRPVVARIDPDQVFVPNPDEVEVVFDVPLAFLLDGANHRRASRHWQGQERFFYELPWPGQHIWGVTAGIIRLFSERVQG